MACAAVLNFELTTSFGCDKKNLKDQWPKEKIKAFLIGRMHVSGANNKIDLYVYS